MKSDNFVKNCSPPSKNHQIEDIVQPPPEIDIRAPQPQLGLIVPQPQLEPIVPQPQLGPIDFAEFNFGGLDEFDRFDIWDNNVELPPVEQVEAAEQLEATEQVEADQDLPIRDPNRSRTTKWRDRKRCKDTFDRETIATAHGDLCENNSAKKVMKLIDRNPNIAEAALKYIEALDTGDGMYT